MSTNTIFSVCHNWLATIFCFYLRFFKHNRFWITRRKNHISGLLRTLSCNEYKHIQNDKYPKHCAEVMNDSLGTYETKLNVEIVKYAIYNFTLNWFFFSIFCVLRRTAKDERLSMGCGQPQIENPNCVVFQTIFVFNYLSLTIF